MVQQKFSSKTVRRIRKAVRKIESGGGSTGGTRRNPPAPGGRPIGIGETVGSITANTWGLFRRCIGEKGSETPTGNELDGYYRTKTGSPDLPDETKVYYTWIGDGYELTPCECPDDA